MWTDANVNRTRSGRYNIMLWVSITEQKIACVIHDVCKQYVIRSCFSHCRWMSGLLVGQMDVLSDCLSNQLNWSQVCL